MRSEAWLAAPVLLAHADITKNIKYFLMGPKLWHPTVLDAPSLFCRQCSVTDGHVLEAYDRALRHVSGDVSCDHSSRFTLDWSTCRASAQSVARGIVLSIVDALCEACCGDILKQFAVL